MHNDELTYAVAESEIVCASGRRRVKLERELTEAYLRHNDDAIAAIRRQLKRFSAKPGSALLDNLASEKRELNHSGRCLEMTLFRLGINLPEPLLLVE